MPKRRRVLVAWRPRGRKYWHSFEGRWWLYLGEDGQCPTCRRYTLSVYGLVPVKVDKFTWRAICPLCARAGYASRLVRDWNRGAVKGVGGMIDPNSYPGASRPALKPETIGYPKTNAAVLTIADVDPEVEIPEENGGTRKVLVVIFKEFPDLTFYTNKTSRSALIEKLGLNEKKWVGERVPLIVVQVNNPRTKKPQPSLFVADPEEWDGHLSRGARRGGRR